MRIFTIIIGVITLLSFAIQLSEALPDYQNIVEKISYILLGVLAGLIFSLFDKIKIKIKKVTNYQLFAYVFYIFIGLIIIIVLVSIVLTEDTEKITTLKTILGSIGTFTFVSFFFVLKLISRDDGLNIDERIVLAEKYFEEENYSRSLHFYFGLQDLLDEEDTRLDFINDRVEEIKEIQVKPKFKMLK